MHLAFDLLFSEEDQNHSLGENAEEPLIEINLRPSRGGTEKNIFSVLLPILCLNGDWLEGRGSVSG